ncbi:hypothetical protein [Runella zeae]|uniref:hypothetical protein n=1 Tax=Runella zeae TaxID=94255 RepID=UPI002352D3DE|nr:hypothetical protein [Runella zeae]
MKDVNLDIVELELIKLIDEINKNVLQSEIEVDATFCPGDTGISSQIILTIISRVSSILEITIPDDCYIFYDKKEHRQLTIKEAAQKLIEKAKNGNK